MSYVQSEWIQAGALMFEPHPSNVFLRWIANDDTAHFSVADKTLRNETCVLPLELQFEDLTDLDSLSHSFTNSPSRTLTSFGFITSLPKICETKSELQRIYLHDSKSCDIDTCKNRQRHPLDVSRQTRLWSLGRIRVCSASGITNFSPKLKFVLLFVIPVFTFCFLKRARCTSDVVV